MEYWGPYPLYLEWNEKLILSSCLRPCLLSFSSHLYLSHLMRSPVPFISPFPLLFIIFIILYIILYRESCKESLPLFIPLIFLLCPSFHLFFFLVIPLPCRFISFLYCLYYLYIHHTLRGYWVLKHLPIGKVLLWWAQKIPQFQTSVLLPCLLCLSSLLCSWKHSFSLPVFHSFLPWMLRVGKWKLCAKMKFKFCRYFFKKAARLFLTSMEFLRAKKKFCRNWKKTSLNF